MALSDEAMVASYPFEIGKRLGIDPGWVPALAAQSPGRATVVMPLLSELTEGLEAMIE
jgi:hypothetical protein